MEFVFASHSFDVWESWTMEGSLDECRLVNCRNPLVKFSFIFFLLLVENPLDLVSVECFLASAFLHNSIN